MNTERIMSVMAPLMINENMEHEFKQNLKEAKDRGVEAVTVDIWWGLVMKNRRQPDWSYYKKVFSWITYAGLKIVPIIAFHRCGGGPGDTENFPLPTWLYSEVAAEANLESDDLRYESETGRKCSDYLPPWVASLKPIQKVMMEFMDSFVNVAEFKQYAANGDIPEINISMGPTGELRYPSYNKADGWGFPHRGYFQAYNTPARQSFRKWALDNSKHWAMDYKTRPYVIRPPFGHNDSDFNQGSPTLGKARADEFVAERIHKDPGYGQDFIEWYHQSLLAHCRNLLTLADKCFSNSFKRIPLGMKIPGIHWQWRETDIPRYAELTTGLMPYSKDLVSGDNPSSEHTGYESIFECVSQLKQKLKRNIIVHFTALEMDDDSAPRETHPSKRTSMAHTLVNSVGKTAQKYGVTLSGENAIQMVNSYGDDRTWEYIHKVFHTGFYSGFTLLRLCEDMWNTDSYEYMHFIKVHDKDAIAEAVGG